MTNMGELIDAFEKAENDGAVWLSMMLRHCNDEDLANFKLFPITDVNVHMLSTAIVMEIKSYLAGVSTEERFGSICAEGHSLQAALWKLLEGMNIPREVVFLPISYAEMAAAAGVVTIDEDGGVRLTAAGLSLAQDMLEDTE